MIEYFGRAGLPPNPLQPPVTAPRVFCQGPFSAVLRPSLHALQRGTYPDELVLDCLVHQPDPDGLGAVRLVLAGHAPVPVGLLSFRTGLLAVPGRVSFEAAGQADVVSIGLFDQDGILCAWGSHRPSSKRAGRPAALEFPSHQIMVRALPAGRPSAGTASV